MVKNKPLLFLAFLFFFSVMTAAFMATPVKAVQDSSGFPSITVESYTYNGVKTYCSGESVVQVPVGAIVDFRVWVDLYNVDPVKLAYADGTADTFNFGGSFSHDFYHTYQTASSGYIPEAYMPTDSGTFTCFCGSLLEIGQSAQNQGGSGGNSGNPVDQVYAFFRTVGQAFGLSGDNAAIAGVLACCLIFTPLALALTHSFRANRAKRFGTSPRPTKKMRPSYIHQTPPTYSQPDNPQTNDATPAGYPITADQGQPIGGVGITGTAIPPGLPSINLRSKWASLNPGAASLDAVRQVNLNWDSLSYDPNVYKLEGYEIWKLYDQLPTARLGPDATSWSGTFRGEVQGVTLRAIFSMPTGDYRYVFATSHVLL